MANILEVRQGSLNLCDVITEAPYGTTTIDLRLVLHAKSPIDELVFDCSLVSPKIATPENSTHITGGLVSMTHGPILLRPTFLPDQQQTSNSLPYLFSQPFGPPGASCQPHQPVFRSDDECSLLDMAVSRLPQINPELVELREHFLWVYTGPLVACSSDLDDLAAAVGCSDSIRIEPIEHEGLVTWRLVKSAGQTRA